MCSAHRIDLSANYVTTTRKRGRGAARSVLIKDVIAGKVINKLELMIPGGGGDEATFIHFLWVLS